MCGLRPPRPPLSQLSRVILGLLGLFDGELGRRVRLQPLVRDRLTTPDRSSERPCVKSRFSPVEGGEPVPKTGCRARRRRSAPPVPRPRRSTRRGPRRPLGPTVPSPLRRRRSSCTLTRSASDQASSPLLVHIASSTRRRPLPSNHAGVAVRSADALLPVEYPRAPSIAGCSGVASLRSAGNSLRSRPHYPTLSARNPPEGYPVLTSRLPRRAASRRASASACIESRT